MIDQAMIPSRWQRAVRACALAVVLVAAQTAQAQFLRLGPFDFTASTYLEGVYTTNVEQERESEADLEREDYYLITGLDLVSKADLSPRTTLDLDTGISVEKHFVRDDLDNSESPFGRARATTRTELRHLTLTLEAGWEREEALETDPGDDEKKVVFADGRSSKTRNPSTHTWYSGGADWKGGPFSAGASYEFDRERYEKENFQDGDKDDTTIGWYAGWQLLDNLKFLYDYERTKTEMINDPEDDPSWEVTENYSLDWDANLWERPKFTYALGLEREDSDGEKGEWDVTHDFGLSDQYEFGPRMKAGWSVEYGIEEDPEEDDVAFTYSGYIRHEIDRYTMHEVTATREPRETFGSTTDSDSTEYTYSITRRDLLLIDLNARAAVSYEIDKPVDGPTEKVYSYDFTLEHRVAVTRRLSRVLEYLYTREDSNLEDELLEEHRVTLRYEYAL